MRGTVLYAARDVRFDEVASPKIEKPTDAVIRVSATCVCGSDLWPYRGVQPIQGPTPMGHEYCGVVEEVGRAVRSVKPGQFVVGSFATSDNTCPHCRYGYQSSCVEREFMSRAQAPVLRVPHADGTLVPTPGMPPADLLPSLLTISDVLGTGWFAADAAGVKPGATVAVVGDGAVGLCSVIAAKRLGAERIIILGRHEDRTDLAKEFGATDVVAERGKAAVERVKELTGGAGAHAVLECVGYEEAFGTALRIARPGGAVGRVGVPQFEAIPGAQPTFLKNVTVSGGIAPARAYIEELLPEVLDGTLVPGRVFDRAIGLDEVPDGYRAMDEREAIKVLVKP